MTPYDHSSSHAFLKLSYFELMMRLQTNTNKTGSTTLREWTTPDSRNTPSTTNLEEEETVDAPGNDANVSMLEQVKQPNPWRKMMMMMMRLHYEAQGDRELQEVTYSPTKLSED